MEHMSSSLFQKKKKKTCEFWEGLNCELLDCSKLGGKVLDWTVHGEAFEDELFESGEEVILLDNADDDDDGDSLVDWEILRSVEFWGPSDCVLNEISSTLLVGVVGADECWLSRERVGCSVRSDVEFVARDGLNGRALQKQMILILFRF